MKDPVNTRNHALAKLCISELNQMQLESDNAIQKHPEVILTSPTGTGKTLAYLLPLISLIDHEILNCVQMVVVLPTRELGLQIEQVIRQMGTGLKVNAVYGGRSVKKDKSELATLPIILVGTPGRIADHIDRGTFDPETVRFLVLDEFDKSLEIGFEVDMSYICNALINTERKVLCSATSNIGLPSFVGMKEAITLSFHDKGGAQLSIRTIVSPEKDKLHTLYKSLCWLGGQTGIVFCNYKDSIERISTYLSEQGIEHGVYHGGLEQKERERSLIKFRNGTFSVLLATDLAARGLDIPELSYLIHYHFPHHKHEYVHRNGRTARMTAGGTAYVLSHESDLLPEYLTLGDTVIVPEAPAPDPTHKHTVFVSGGRKDKISKGDLAGFFAKQGGMPYADIGEIEVKVDCAFIGIHAIHIEKVIDKLNNQKLKKKKVRVYKI